MEPHGTCESREILLFGWDGGGNVPPLVALGKHLLRRGHTVRMVGTETMAGRAREAGIDFRPFSRPPSWAPRPGLALEDEYEAFVAHLLGPELGEELLGAAGRSQPDAIVVDHMAGGALSAAEYLDVPAAVLVHCRARFHHDQPKGSEVSRPFREALNRQRVRLGLEPHPIEANWWPHLWQGAGAVFIASLPEIEGPGEALPESFTYVGGVFDPEPQELPEEVAAFVDAGQEPLAVVSLSTTYMHQERQLEKVAAALDGVAAVITTGPGVQAGAVLAAGNNVVTSWAPHERLLPHADVVVTHAGHGTVVAALTAGVPLVCVPMGRDQDGNAEQVARAGAGVSVDAGADPQEIRAAIEEVLAGAGYREAARALAGRAARLGGGERLAGEVEALAGADPARREKALAERKGT